MRITFLALRRYLPFMFSNIELLEMRLTSDIQNIIGSNGSGKSSLLRELNPRPPTRTAFGDQGYKHITVMHNGLEYELRSDFSTSSSPHSFRREGVELNTSGTTSLQEELVRRELGYTPQVHAVCYGEQRLSSIRVGLRETFLLTIHPCQLKLVMDKHKIIERKIRGFRDTLGLLYERRTVLTSQMLEDTTRQSLQSENASLSHQIAQIVESLHRLNSQIQTITRQLASYPKDYKVRSAEENKRSQRRYPLFQSIPRDQSLETFRAHVVNAISRDKTQCEALTTQIQTLTAEIDRYEHYLSQSDAAGAIATIEQMLDELKQHITVLETDPVERPFDSYTMEHMDEHLSRLTDLIGVFIGYREPIPDRETVQRTHLKHEKIMRQMALCEQDVETKRILLSTIEHRITSHVIENIPTGCHDCVLFHHYSKTINLLQDEYQQASISLRKAERRQKRLTLLMEGRRHRLDLYQQIIPHLHSLQTYLNENWALRIPLEEIDILNTLRQNPSHLLVRIQTHAERSYRHHRLVEKRAELDKRISEYERLKIPSTFGKSFLEALIAEKHQDLNNLRSRYESFRLSLDENHSLHTLIGDYVNEISQLTEEDRILAQKESYETLQFERHVCERYHEVLTNAQRDSVRRLSEIESALREQNALMSKLEEIVTTINAVETDLNDFTLIEKSLSPTTGIPYGYMIQFINELIHCANHFLRKVFSYPFAFIPRIEGEPLDYKFRMRVGDVIVPDISDCSDAQKDMADLAFRLAQFVQLQLTNYPIYLDESDRAFDHHHKQQLLDLIKTLVSEQIVSQLCMVNHNVAMYSGTQDSETLVLNENNIIVPKTFNEHVTIVH